MWNKTKYLTLSTLLIITTPIQALSTKSLEEKADASIQALYHSLDLIPNSSMSERLNQISNQFLTIPYVLGSLGEGPKAKYDQFPRYRTDGFDCDTYVNTVLALALSDNLSSFKHCINTLRYENGEVSYIKRNHFTALDWNKNNQDNGILKDITLKMKDKTHHSVARFSSTLINKPGWYAHKTVTTIRIDSENLSLQKQRLSELQEEGSNLPIKNSSIAYIPLSALFPQTDKPDLYLFSQIPDGAIIEIIRPNWDLRKVIGTSLDVSHLGFAFWDKKTLYFRQASSQYNQVVNVPLISYLADATKSPTIKGINIQIVVPKKANDSCGR